MASEDGAPPPRALRRRVQAIFERRADCIAVPLTAKPASAVDKPHRRVFSLAHNLRCVHQAKGKAALSVLLDALVGGKVKSHHVAQALFDVDGVGDDDAAPLCNVAHLISLGHVALRDVDAERFLACAVAELGDSDTAVHERGCSGVTGAVKKVLATGRSQVRDDFLRVLMRPLLNPNASSSRGLQVVGVVLQAVGEVLQLRERSHHLMRWARGVLLDLGVASPVEDGAWGDAVLRDLAVTLNAVHHLNYRTAECKALDALFGKLGSEATASLVDDVLASVAGASRKSGDYRYARIACFFRSCMKHHEDDAALFQRVSASLTSALCALKSKTDAHLQAVVVTLARFFHSTADTETKAHVLYEKWFLLVLKTGTKPCIELLLSVISELVPYEPLAYLRIQARCCRRVASWAGIVRDYVALAATRVKDLEPDAPKKHAGKKAMEDLCKFVTDFHHAGAKAVPQALVRRMNFHRFSFRTSILPLLLSDALEVPQMLLHDDFAMGGLKAFDDARIKLIKILAYERNDRAVKKNEADEAIPKIQAAIRKRAEQVREGKGFGALVAVEVREELKEDAHIAVLFERFCEVGGTLQDGAGAVVKEDGERVPVEQVLISKLLAYEDASDAACALLQLFADRMQHSAAGSETGDIGVPALVNGVGGGENDSFRLEHRALWKSCEGWALDLLKVCARPEVAAVWEQVLLQSFGCLCLKQGCASTKQLVAMAVLHYAATRFTDEHVGRALSYLYDSHRLMHVVEAVATYGRLDRAVSVRATLLYASTYNMLVVANASCVSFEPLRVPTRGVDGTHFWPSSDVRPLADVVPPCIVSLLRWGLTSSWRMADDAPPSTARYQVLVALKQLVAAVRAIDLVGCKALEVEDWVRVESRCGWGAPDRVAVCIRAFEGASTDTLGRLVAAVAELSWRAQIPAWIVLGAARYARAGGAVALDPLSQTVDKLLNEKQEVARAAVGIALDLPDTMYFRSVSASAACDHVTKLAELQWPHSAALVSHLVHALRRCEFDDIRVPPTFVASTAYYAAADPVLADAVASLPSSWLALDLGVNALKSVLQGLRRAAAGTQRTQTQLPTQGVGGADHADAAALVLYHVAVDGECAMHASRLGSGAATALDAALDAAVCAGATTVASRLLQARLSMTPAPRPLEHSPCAAPPTIRRVRAALGRRSACAASRKRPRVPNGTSSPADAMPCVTARARRARALADADTSLLPTEIVAPLVDVLSDIRAKQRGTPCGACACSCVCASLRRGELAASYDVAHGTLARALDRGDAVDDRTLRMLRTCARDLCSRVRAHAP